MILYPREKAETWSFFISEFSTLAILIVSKMIKMFYGFPLHTAWKCYDSCDINVDGILC